MKRIVCLLFVTVLCLLFAVSAAASETLPDTSGALPDTTAIVDTTGIVEDTSGVIADTTAIVDTSGVIADTSAVSDTAGDVEETTAAVIIGGSGEGGEFVSFTDYIYALWLKYNGAIFSLITAISTLCYGVFAKKKVLPGLDATLKVITGTVADEVEKTKKDTEVKVSAIGAAVDAVDKRYALFIKDVEPVLGKVAEALEAVRVMKEKFDGTAAELKAAQDERDVVKDVLLNQSQLLFNLIDTSDLPQVRKDVYFAEYHKMVNRVKGGDGNDGKA